MTLRAFRTTFLVAFDDEESDAALMALDFDDVPQTTTPATLDQIKDYLKEALRIVVNTEDFDDPHGFQSAEVHLEQLVELDQAEVTKLYSHTEPADGGNNQPEGA